MCHSVGPTGVVLGPSKGIILVSFKATERCGRGGVRSAAYLNAVKCTTPRRFNKVKRASTEASVCYLKTAVCRLIAKVGPYRPPCRVEPVERVSPALSNNLRHVVAGYARPSPGGECRDTTRLVCSLRRCARVSSVCEGGLGEGLTMFVAASILAVLLKADAMLDCYTTRRGGGRGCGDVLGRTSACSGCSGKCCATVIASPAEARTCLGLGSGLASSFILSESRTRVLGELVMNVSYGSRGNQIRACSIVTGLGKGGPGKCRSMYCGVNRDFLFCCRVGIRGSECSDTTR